MAIIDFHTHVLPHWVQSNRETIAKDDSCFGMLYANPQAKLATTEDLIRSMDDAGIDTSVVLNIGWGSHEMCCRTNDYLLESGSRWPHRITPFCMVQPLARDLALHEIERCAAAGARGIGELRPDTQGYSLLDADLLAPLVDVAMAHDMALLLHTSEPVGHAYPGKGALTPEQPYGLARSFPHAMLVCAHWGGGLPFYALMPEVRDALSNVYYDTAATQYLYRPEVFAIVARIAGGERLLFGSDFPLIGQQRALDHARSSGLSEPEMNALLGGNASQLLSLRSK